MGDDDEYNILDDDWTGLYKEYVEIVEELRPKALVMENVEGMVSEIDDTGIKVDDLVIDALEPIGASGHGYVCDYQLIDCTEYGIPQHRKRVIILGVRIDSCGDVFGVTGIDAEVPGGEFRELVVMYVIHNVKHVTEP